MGKEKQVRISQCMIVKNEENNIERALTWGKAIMWEQIVVDTGSTDSTVELARKLGAKVFFFPWIDDFSAAKNYAIEQAKGEWIAFLDADEYMDLKSAGKVKEVIEYISKDTFDGVSTGCQQVDEEGKIFSSGTQIRFFRNIPDIRYRRRIHEQLESITGRELRIGNVANELSIFHTGYQNAVMREKKKSERNRNLILEELKENPENYEMLGYMGDEFFEDGEMNEAEKWYHRAMKNIPSSINSYDQRSAVTFTRLLLLLIGKEGDSWEEVKPVYEKAVSVLPEEPDFDYVVGRYFAERGQGEMAVWHLETAVKKLDMYGCYNKAMLFAAELLEAYDLLVRCCYESGLSQKCMNHGVTYLKYDKYGMGVLARVLKTLLPDGGTEKAENQAVLEFFSKLYDFGNLKDRLFLIKAAQRSDCHGFADYGITKLFTAKEQKALGLQEGKEETI